MEATNRLVQLENTKEEVIGYYLTTRNDNKEFQVNFDTALEQAKELMKGDTEGWETRDYLDEILAGKFDLWRVYSDVVNLNL